ncbi:MAG: amylosucrase, partial [Chloroflexi bacterium]|nr:amylosucrase [Chloroflexota bacterium]
MQPDPQWLREQAAHSLERLLPRLAAVLADGAAKDVFVERLNQHFPGLFEQLIKLYGAHYDFFYHLEQTLIVIA